MNEKIKCPLCKGTMIKGKTELLFKKSRSVVVIEEVPALVCEQCDEASIDLKTSKRAYNLANEEISRGVALEFFKYKKAA